MYFDPRKQYSIVLAYSQYLYIDDMGDDVVLGPIDAERLIYLVRDVAQERKATAVSVYELGLDGEPQKLVLRVNGRAIEQDHRDTYESHVESTEIAAHQYASRWLQVTAVSIGTTAVSILHSMNPMLILLVGTTTCLSIACTVDCLHQFSLTRTLCNLGLKRKPSRFLPENPMPKWEFDV